MRRAKIIAAAVLAFLMLIIILQNTEPTQTDILFWSATMPRALLLFISALAGFVLGVLVFLLLGRRRSPPPP